MDGSRRRPESQDPKPESETNRGAATDDDDEGTAQNKQANKGKDKASGVQ